MVVLRVAEFFSGIGGLHCACELTNRRFHQRGHDVTLKVEVAYEIDSVGSSVYAHNLSITPTSKDISRITPKQLDALNVDLWLLSPPCQPYTRLGNQKGSLDPRAKALTHLTESIPKLANPPRAIILENVVGFEKSDSRDMLLEQLQRSGYSFIECHLSPTDIAIPNQRMRYFCVAWRTHTARNEEPGGAIRCPLPANSRNLELLSVPPFSPPRPILDFLDTHVDESHTIPSDRVSRYIGVMDVVTRDASWSCCFTKSYSKYFEGTGSLLDITPPEHKSPPSASNDPTQSACATSKTPDTVLRLFTPAEILRLHCFPTEFSFPEHVTLRKRYQLLGNSLNCAVVAHLIGCVIEKIGAVHEVVV